MAVEERIESYYRWCIEKLVAEEVVVRLNVFTSYSYPLKSIPYQSTQYTNIHTHALARTCTICLGRYIYNIYVCVCE